MEHIQEVPFLCLKSQKDALKVEIVEALSSSIESSGFIMGDRFELFENGLAARRGFEFAQGSSSGTAALHAGLFPHGAGPGGEDPTVRGSLAASIEAAPIAGSRSAMRDAYDDTSSIHNQMISIPVFSEYSSSQLEYVVDNLGKVAVSIEP